jgi:hypothetical protein
MPGFGLFDFEGADSIVVSASANPFFVLNGWELQVRPQRVFHLRRS